MITLDASKLSCVLEKFGYVIVFAVKLTIGVSVCVPLFSSKNSKSSGFALPNVVPLIPVMIRSAVPFVVNRTVQFPPTVGVE